METSQKPLKFKLLEKVMFMENTFTLAELHQQCELWVLIGVNSSGSLSRTMYIQ